MPLALFNKCLFCLLPYFADAILSIDSSELSRALQRDARWGFRDEESRVGRLVVMVAVERWFAG